MAFEIKKSQMTRKNFNSYKDGLDLRFLRQFCLEHGTLKTMEKGEVLEKAGEPARWVAYVKEGYFKYMTHNATEGRDYCVGFALTDEFVADFPYCLHGYSSRVTIEAGMPSVVCICDGQELQQLFTSSNRMTQRKMDILENLFIMVYDRLVDYRRYTPAERYQQLVDRCPQIIQQLPLTDIASFLNITPTYLSVIRKKMMLDKE